MEDASAVVKQEEARRASYSVKSVSFKSHEPLHERTAHHINAPLLATKEDDVEAAHEPAVSAMEPKAATIGIFLVIYVISSSSMSIANKWAIKELPLPGIVTACQFFATSVFVGTLGLLGVIDVEPLELRKVVRMLPINVIFYTAILSNTKVLQYSTVETFIAFRSLTPLLVATVDTFVRGSPRPSLRTIACLLLIVFGAANYAWEDHIRKIGYEWASLYLVVIVIEMVYAKHITSTIGLGTWSLVLYQNAIALVIWPFVSLVTGEFSVISDYWIRLDQGWAIQRTTVFRDATSNATTTIVLSAATAAATDIHAQRRSLSDILYHHHGLPPVLHLATSCILPLFVSSILSVAISFSSWGTRAALSATQFTVLGLACKLVTVALNFFIWDDHAPLESQGFILVCIFASLMYSKSAEYDKAALAVEHAHAGS